MTTVGTTRNALVTLCESFLAASGMSETRFGEAIAGNKKLLRRVRDGVVTLNTVERIEGYIAAHS